MRDNFPSIQLHFCWVEVWNFPSLPLSFVRFQHLICTWTFCVKFEVHCLLESSLSSKKVCYDLKHVWGVCEQRKLHEADSWTRSKEKHGSPQQPWDHLFGSQWKKSNLPNQLFQSIIFWFLSDVTTFQSLNNRNTAPFWSTGEQLCKFIRRQRVFTSIEQRPITDAKLDNTGAICC